MPKNPGQQGGPDRGGRRPGKESQTHQKQHGPDKLSGGGMPPHADPKKGGK